MNHSINFPIFESGSVWLAGAGPGDPGLLTLHTINAMQQADIAIYDALIDNSILHFLPHNAKRIYVGKRGGYRSIKQSHISLQLIKYAKKGLRVLRLKGGDPFIFGRGAEEALILYNHNIPFRILPGITAGMAASTYAGIPLTHRDYNSSIIFITGHSANGDIPNNIHWKLLSQDNCVLVIYMAIKYIDIIALKLISNGRKINEPVAVIHQGTRPDQRILITTLEKVSHDVETAKLQSPAICIIGKIIKLKDFIPLFEQPENQKKIRSRDVSIENILQ